MLLQQPSPQQQLDFATREDPYSFLRRAFPILHPGTPFIPNWHLEALCFEVMKFLADDNLRHLVINLPPRSLKSILLSVVFPAYLLGRDPTLQMFCYSYAKPLADSLARDARAVMESAWYRRVFPGTSIQRANEEGLFTTQRGFRRHSTVDGSVTGLGGAILLADDLIQPEEARSEAVREKRNAWVKSTLLGRANDKRSSKTILIGHRVHEDDPTATMLKFPYTRHICMPAIADDDYLFDLPFGRTFIWKNGEPLQAVREPLKVLALERERQGERNFSSLYLQAPVPVDGGIIRPSWFRYYDEAPAAELGDRRIFSWDTAMTDSAMADYSVCTEWLVKKNRYYLLNVFRERLRYPDLKRKIAGQADTNRGAIILVEDKGSGMSVAQDLSRDGIGVIKFKPEADKEMRASIASDQIEPGNVFLPRQAHWLAAFLSECAAFPRGRHDDQVDSMSQAIIWNLNKKRAPGTTLFGHY